MRVRNIAIQIWLAASLAWLAGTGVLAASGFLEARFGDDVRLEQHARDLRAAGIDPASVDWTAPVVADGFLVPPARLEAPGFWRREGGSYLLIGAALPVPSLLLMEIAVALAASLSASGAASGGARRKPLVFPKVADSVPPCSQYSVSAASPSRA